ncbi:phosphoribosylformylglycinamidine synthase [Thomasclavelia sp.]|uniref:phosphoribosylformylglycinamidine synthase n=1 Tax=Thomasclavelia sp. TaxID=3025757 RepID=UPI0025E83BF3|nr:phosphoribosylformylglycinamidine synthase [Thomasclavelia sp.]
MSSVKRIYVEKRPAYATEANETKQNLTQQLGIKINSLRIINRYDVQGIDDEILKQGINTILAEPMVDDVYQENFPVNDQESIFAIEFLPGQYDQRADSCNQCFAILTGNSDAKVKCARVYAIDLDGDKETELKRIQNFLINPVDQRLASLEKPENLDDAIIDIKPVPTITGFNELDQAGLENYLKVNGMAMSYDDLKVTQDYFKNEEKRDPTETELKVLDTYWSDHCRHTTFATVITDLDIESGAFKEILAKDVEDYKTSRHLVYGIDTKRPLTLMDLATISMKELRKTGYLDDLEVSEEINACSVEITVHTSEGDEQWLLMFKNETHNHPTEIEPFGGAATCLGGAIRDPLSGRAYVYQSMRITGASDPRKSLEETIPGKLPQRKLCKESAHGFSSYGNQIGLTTGYVHEIYDDGYMAKRMELGAVVAAAPKDQVKRLEPLKDHIVLLIGGRTGRDGIGGATGSSKSHDVKSIETAGAEVQKGNPVEERKIQRLFRNKEVSEKIVRCNDFGAGGVCVAVGELAPGLEINLDAVLKKYEGLTGTELAISESQERMAIVIDPKDADFIKEQCSKENLEVVQVAVVTDQNRLVMKHQGQDIVNISRDFLDAAGAKRYQDIKITLPDFEKTPFDEVPQTNFVKTVKETLSKLSVASQKGLIEMFDSSIGNGTVLSPFGGIKYHSEVEGMAALIPVLDKETTTCSIMAYGYNPVISKWSPYHGAMYAIVESVAKIVAMGGNYHKIRFSFQEYFEKLLDNPVSWGKPMAALLGAYRVQSALKLASIGGKDSMSGSFEDLHVPPTLVSFAITSGEVDDIMTPEAKETGHVLAEIMINKDEFKVFDFNHLQKQYDAIMALMKEKKIYSAYTVKDGGIIEAVSKMAFGNGVGVAFNNEYSLESYTVRDYGNIVIEVKSEKDLSVFDSYRIVATTNDSEALSYGGDMISLDEAYAVNKAPLEKVYPTREKAPTSEIKVAACKTRSNLQAKVIVDEPLVVIPVFPGTNCEYDSARAFKKAGAKVETVLIRNKTQSMLNDSINELEAAIKKANIVMLPGGFSAGDEPEGSGKFIATVLRNPRLKAAITDLLENRDGLMIGICNGFQALVKLGLLPYGKIKDMSKDDPTLTFNTIGRHVSQMVDTRIGSVKSPWLKYVNVDDIYTIPVSHGEGRFVAPKKVMEELFENGQVFSQYVDPNRKVTMQTPYNPNGSMYAIEGIISLDGRVIGKMGHSERQGENRFKNVYGEMDQKLFEAGVDYFRGGK